ncbi:ANK1 [Symbiodinium natans]|uniref:ANK1 protein n=1 Tax=Symbiodinium natans TaxID=878477 RepID=A0A812G7F9_9DINO|nr:ANK1 [Symbiodinium natans]
MATTPRAWRAPGVNLTTRAGWSSVLRPPTASRAPWWWTKGSLPRPPRGEPRHWQPQRSRCARRLPRNSPRSWTSASGNFADWYFAYPTTIKLVREAATSAARHSADLSRTTPLKTAIAMDLDDVLMQKYERIVLQPELNNAKLQEAFLNTAKDLHQRFCRDIRDLDDQLLRELAKRTSHLEEPSHDAVHLTLDWSSQRHKVKAVPAQFEKMPELSLALGVGGAVAAKAAGASLSSKVAGAAAGKAVCSKLSAPFALKALGGTAVAGLLAGPVGGAVGLAAGVGADVALHRGLELLQRKDFEAEVLRAVQATRDEYFQTLEAELHRALGAWMADARHLAYTSPAAAE